MPEPRSSAPQVPRSRVLMSQPVKLKKLKLNSSMKTYKTFYTQRDGDQEGGTGPQDQKKEETEGQGQPVLPALVVREADEDEFGDWGSPD